MTIDEFIGQIDKKQPPAPPDELTLFEAQIGQRLPEDYRQFLSRTNGGHVGGRSWFVGPTPEGKVADAGIHHVGGFRAETYFSLTSSRRCYARRIPRELIWIMDDPFGNAICLGISGDQRGRVFFWDHENEPDEEEWDGRLETAGNVQLLANSFADLVAGLRIPENE